MIVLGLGSNLGNRLENLRAALTLIKQIPDLTFLSCSPVYESDALMPENVEPDWNQPFLNCAVGCNYSKDPEQLLFDLQKIEQTIGRSKVREKWSPRLIDIDILVCDDLVINNEKLTVPHPGLFDRPFALWPLADLYPDWKYYNDTAQKIVRKWGSRHTGQCPQHTKQIMHRIDCPRIVGILNITPDSFSDGGKFVALESALQQAIALYDSGADVIDIGAESTRPGCFAVSAKEEWQRLAPVLKEVLSFWHNKKSRPLISVDTRRANIAEKALSIGVDWINDVTGFSDRKMVEVVKAATCKLVFMHSLTIPADSKVTLNENEDVIASLIKWAWLRIHELENAGIDRDRLIFDPGIGFGKIAAQSFAIIKRVLEFQQLNMPILLGHSRKSFLNLFTNLPFSERDLETNVISQYLVDKVDYLRVHNVEHLLRALKVKKGITAAALCSNTPL